MRLQILLIVSLSASAQRWNYQTWPHTLEHSQYHVPYYFNKGDLGYATNPEVTSNPQTTTAASNVALCADPANRDAIFCQARPFTKTGEKIPIFWKSRNIALSPILNKVGGSLQLRTYDANDPNQKWVLTVAREASQLFIITNAAESDLALTANGYPSVLTLQKNVGADNQKFYVRPQTDGSFTISAYGSDLYWDAIEIDSGSLPVLTIRNFEGDTTQKWTLD